MQNKRALTLVEMLVVITIIAILWTIGFLSYVSYTSSARDATRGADITNINRVLSLHKTSKLRYPKASEAVEVTYSGAKLWEQWTFGRETKAELGKIFGELTDPQYGNQYTYSVTSNKKEYQIAALFESEDGRPNDVSIRSLQALNLPDVIPTTYASGDFDPLELSPQIWLDATDVDGDGATNDNPSNGGTITAWKNKSAAWAANDPIFTWGSIQYATTGLDGSYPGVYIDDDMWVTLNNSAITQWDIFYVVQNRDPFGSNTDNNGRALQSTTGNYLIGYWSNRRHALYINGSPSHYASSPSTTSGRTSYAFIYGFHTDGTNYSFRDVWNLIWSPWATQSIAGREWWFNLAGAFPNERAEFVVSEILIFNTSLSSDDRQKVEWYLAHKWGQDNWLSSSHPYKSDPPESSGPPPTPDTDPAQFTFNDETNVPLSTQRISNQVSITDINTAAPISISGGEYSIDGAAYTSSNGTVNQWQNVQVRVTSSASNDTPVDAVLTVGSISDTYTVRTLIADTTPDSFTFNAVTDLDVNTTRTSNTATISGLNTTVPISISGPSIWPVATYKISDGVAADATWAWTASSSTNYPGSTASEAFDNNTSSTGWGANSSFPVQLSYDLGSWNEAIITRYTLYRDWSQDGWFWYQNESPRDWTFEGSNNGTDWNELDNRVNEFINPDSTKKEYSFTNTIFYRYYRLNITDNNAGGNWVNITEMELIDEWGLWTYTSSAGTVSNWDVVSVRMSSSASAGTTNTATLTVGSYATNYELTTIGPDTTPNTFSFTDEVDADPNTQYIRSFTLSGINTSTTATMTGDGWFIVNGTGGLVSSATVNDWDQIEVRLTSWAFGTTRSTTLEIWAWPSVSATFNVSTSSPPLDSQADAFSFIDRDDVALSTNQISNTITVTGITAPNIPVNITGWSYDINGSNTYVTTAGSVANGDTISVQITSSSTPNDPTNVTLTLWTWADEVSDTFTVTTVDPDTQPAPFSFATVSDANINEVRYSNPITITDINTSTTASISGGGWEFSINGWSYITSWSVNAWDEIIVRLTAAATWWSVATNTTLTVGSPSEQATFTVETWAWDTTPDAFGFNNVSDANLNSVYTSDTISITGINAPASISVVGWLYRIWGTWVFTNTSGVINNDDTVTVQLTSSIVGSDPRTATLTIGWVDGTYTVTTQPFTPPAGPTITIPQSNVYVSWEYNGLIAHAQSWATHYIVATPSIMTYDSSDTDILSIIANQKLVYNGFDNIPSSYSGANLTLSGWFDFNITAPLLYEWTREDLGSYGWLKQIDEGIRSTYNNFPYYKNVAEYLDDYSLNYLESIIGGIIGINPIKPFYCSDILQTKLVYNVAPQATVTASPSGFGSLWVEAITNGIKSTQGAADYEYHSADPNAMIEFEWPEQQQIWYVRIYNRTGCCSDRLTGATIKLYNDAWGLLYSHPLWDTSGDYVIDLDLEWIGQLHFVKRLTIETVWGNLLNIREVELFLGGWLKSGTYKVDKDGLGWQSPYNVYCDMVTDWGGWTRIGEDYIENGEFKNQFHIDQHTFPYGSGASTNVIVAHSTQAPPSALPDAFVLRHSDPSGTRAYPLAFDTIPGEFFAQEIRLSGWVRGTTASMFNNTILYDDGSTATSTPEYEVMETDGQWEYRRVRIPLDGLVDDFTWDVAQGIAGTIYFTGLKMEVYYK